MDKKVGDEVWIDGYTSMAQQSAPDKSVIEKIRYKYDVDTGVPYPIYLVAGHWYDSRTGGDCDNKQSMYYMEL
jgi:hypothetical protein